MEYTELFNKRINEENTLNNLPSTKVGLLLNKLIFLFMLSNCWSWESRPKKTIRRMCGTKY
jgi:hypothetical protein